MSGKKNDEHIGNIKIGAIKNNHRVGSVSLFIGDKKSWGQGLASQAIQTNTALWVDLKRLYS
ncbi:MAG: hypothetical protein RPR97_04495 [Colwellia sp.]